jgi:anaerobic glycerol-3-phosphate dehydrogenase
MNDALKRHLRHDHQVRETEAGTAYRYGDVVFGANVSEQELDAVHRQQHAQEPTRMLHVHPHPRGGRE